MKEGEVVEFKDMDGEWHCALVNYIGIHVIIGIDADGDEVTISKKLEWRYPVDPVRAISDKIISEWCGVSIDNAYDNGHSLVVIDTFIRWLIEHGYIEVKE